MGKMFQNASSLKPLGAAAAILNFIPEQKRKVCRGPSNEHSWTVWL
jgi:hypothetical protein